MTNWRPNLASSDTPLYQRLVEALRADMTSGRLPTGMRLPPHRELAEALGISPGTVTKAYNEAASQGLIYGQVGRGTFVSMIRQTERDQTGGSIDLSLNLPGPALPTELLASALQRIVDRPDFADGLGYTPHLGLLSQRRILAGWLSTAEWQADADNLVICNGAQHAMSLTFAVTCRPGDAILTEAATYHGMKSLADVTPYRLIGLAMDDEGLLPDVLDRACAQSAARVLFVIPTLQNPTARIMGLERRQHIVAVARKHDLLLVEDDVYSFLAEGQTPLAALAPERTFHISSFAKCMAPGLRVGTLVAPSRFIGPLSRLVRATCWMTSPIAAMIACEWIQDGVAASLARSLRTEATRRVEIAKRILGVLIRSDHPPSFHIWLDLQGRSAEQAANSARLRGVIVTPPSAPVVNPAAISGLRVSVGAPPNHERLEWGLRELAIALNNENGTDLAII